MKAETNHEHSQPRLRPRRRHQHAARCGEGLCRRRNRAARRRDRPRQRIPRRPVEEVRRHGPARHDRRRGIRRHRHGLPRPHRRAGGNLARLGLGRPVLRCALQPVRQPDPPQRHRSAAPEVPAQADFRRARRRAGDVRAERRFRRRVDEAERREEGRPLRPERLQDVDHQRRRRRHAGRLCQDRPERRGQGHDRLHRRKGHEGLQPRHPPRQAGHARLEHLSAVLRRLRSAGRKRARAASATAPRC